MTAVKRMMFQKTKTGCTLRNALGSMFNQKVILPQTMHILIELKFMDNDVDSDTFPQR